MFRIVTIAVATSLGFAGAAAAEPHSVKVAFRDLDISRPAGAQTLLTRIERAGRQVCGPPPSIRESREMADFKRCRTEAVANAVRDVQSPMLTALYEGKVGAGSIETAQR